MDSNNWYLPWLFILIIISAVCFVFTVLGIVFLIRKNRKNKHSLKPSQTVLDFNESAPPKTWEKNMMDSNNKIKVVCHFEERIPKGEPCYLLEQDRPFVERFVRFAFDQDNNCFEDAFLENKINRLYEAKEKSGMLHMDTRYFFKNPNYVIFPFHITNDKRSQIIFYYCQTRAIKVFELPKTIYTKTQGNYLAYFNNDCFDEMCFLAFLMEKAPLTSGHEIFGLNGSLEESKLGDYNHDEYFVFEYIYRLLSSDCYWFHPLEDAYQETAMRVLNAYGYPPPYEWQSLLAEISAEMEMKGIFRSKRHNLNEQTLFFLVKKTYSDAVYQYRSEWLGKFVLDIYIPQLNVAIEYQGGQHYKAVRFYGGKESFEKNQKRDVLKRELCEKNGVRLIEWKYNIPITKDNLDLLLSKNK